MEFRLLGPLEVVCDGQPIAIASSRQRIILGMLLLEANHVVPVDRLIDALWGDAPPQTAKTQVQIIISALRHRLHDLGEEIILTHPPGYMIKLSDEMLDLRQFERLTADARVAAATQKIAQAVQQLRAALALWRGPALAAAESEIIQAAAARLNEAQLATLQDCIDLELQLGRHHKVIGELMAVTTEHPLHESFRARLMLALYRSGRQADALDVFHATRAVLKEELGLDPSAELRRLEQAILVGDSQLDLPAPARSVREQGKSGGPPVPRQVPRAIPGLLGREQLIAEVRQALSPADAPGEVDQVPVVVLTGRGGIGKTAVALRAAHAVRDAYPDGQLFVRLRGDARGSISSLLEQLLQSVGVGVDVIPADLDSRACMYRSWLAARRVLIVIDDALNTSEILPFLPGAPGCAALITVRSRFTRPNGVRAFEVPPLEEQAALDLLSSVVGAERVLAEDSDARILVQLSEGVPLALRMVAAKLAARPHWRISEMVRRMKDEERRLDELDIDGVSIRATLSVSYQSLEEKPRRLLRRLALLGAVDFGSWVAAPLLDDDLDTACDFLESLVEAWLVEVKVAEDNLLRFQLHDLVRIYASERLADEESTAERSAAVRRLAGCWLFLVTDAHRRMYGGDFGVLHGTAERWTLSENALDVLLRSPASWLRNERAALVTAIFAACQAGLHELCWDLATTSVTVFELGAYADDWRSTHEIALDVVRSAGNRRGEGALLCSLGTLELTRQLDQARRHFEQSLQIFEELGDIHGRALALGGMAFADRLAGSYDTALERYREAIKEFQLVDDPVGQANALKNMARIHADRQQYDTAEQLLDEVLILGRMIGAQRVLSQAEYELADLYLRRGRLGRAVESFETVLRATQESDDMFGQTYALIGLGNARRMLGDFAEAESTLNEAYAAGEHTDDQLLRGRARLAIAELECARGRPAAALAKADEALSVLGELGTAAAWRARTLELVGFLHERSGQRRIAEYAWRSARELAKDVDPALAAQLSDAISRLGADDRAGG